jgi:hypothetical protein
LTELDKHEDRCQEKANERLIKRLMVAEAQEDDSNSNAILNEEFEETKVQLVGYV